MTVSACFLRPFADTDCAGLLQPAHLIPKQLIRREVLNVPRRMLTDADRTILWDPRVIVPACECHHHALDSSRKLKIPRHRLPRGLEGFAAEHGLTYWLDREYGELTPV